MWAAGQCDSRLHGQEEVAALLRRTLIRLCLKHCVQGGTGITGSMAGKEPPEQWKDSNMPGTGQ